MAQCRSVRPIAVLREPTSEPSWTAIAQVRHAHGRQRDRVPVCRAPTAAVGDTDRQPGRPLTMNRFKPRRYRDGITIPIIWFAVALSLLVHFAALWVWLPQSHLLSVKANEPGKSNALIAQLMPSRSPAPVPSATPSPPPPRPPPPEAVVPRRSEPAPPRRPAPRAVAPPPKIVLDKPALQALEPPAPAEPRVAPTPITPTPAMPPPPAEDLAAYVEAQRRARGETPTASGNIGAPQSGESEAERRNRIVAENLGLNRTPTFGGDERSAGGMFQVRELNYDDAQVYFFGYNKDIARNAKQLIEVRRGNNGDIRTAVVRKIIEIIRENVSNDFVWLSSRTGRRTTLSARPSDNAELEEFIMRDVFLSGP